MDNNTTHSRLQLRPQRHPSKMRKMVQKVVVRVKIEENDESGSKKLKSEGPQPPSDCWSWRKYGQKPIKGSPYPRGYYRCSTSKGCSAKKQVERSRTDASVLLITYTSSHNHPGPQTPLPDPDKECSETVEQETECTETAEAEQECMKEQETGINSKANSNGDDDGGFCHFYQSPFNSSQEEPFATAAAVYEPLSYPHLVKFSTPKSEENDFYDELEELPQTSSFTSFFTRNNFFEERILVNPS